MGVTNRFEGLDLIDRVPDELWMEMTDIAQKAVIKAILKKKKCKKANWLSDEDLQIPKQRREAKGKKKKIRYMHLNTVSKNSQERLKKLSKVNNAEK